MSRNAAPGACSASACGLYQTAKIASEMGFSRFTTTLASSRWKRLDQVAEAGNWAASQFPGVEYWDRNWRKGGLAGSPGRPDPRESLL